MIREVNRQVDRFNGWLMRKIGDGILVLLGIIVSFCITQLSLGLFRLGSRLFRTQCRLAHCLIELFEDRMGHSITHSRVSNFTALLLIWVFLLLPLDASLLLGLAKLLGLARLPFAEGHPFIAPLMVAVPLVFTIIVSLLLQLGGEGAPSEVRWDGSVTPAWSDPHGDLRVGKEIRWH